MPERIVRNLAAKGEVAASDLADDRQELSHRPLQGFLRGLIARRTLQSFGDTVQALGESAGVFQARIKLSGGNVLRKQFDVATGPANFAQL